jgi:hypothetical protein
MTDFHGSDTQPSEIDRLIQAMELQIRLAKEALAERNHEAAVGFLSSTRFIASRASNELSEERPTPDAVSHGPTLRRVDGRAFHHALLEILEDRGEPMAVREIMEELVSKGVGVPGQGRPANVIAHLVRIPRVERTSYGRYTVRPD